MKRRKQYLEEFRHEVLRMAENTAKPIRELEKDCGLSQGLIRQGSSAITPTKQQRPLQSSSKREAEMHRL